MEPEKKSNGALVGSVVIVLILIIGGIYLWKADLAKKQTQEIQNGVSGTDESANTANIETDLNSTNIDSIDNGI